MRLLVFLALPLAVACGGKDTEGVNPGECINGLDDDENGYIDCADPGCLNSPDCEDTGSAPSGSGDEPDTGMSGGSGGTGETGGDTSGSGETGGDSSGSGETGGDTSGSGDAGGSGDDGSTVDGASLYATHCATCHGPSAEGASGPGLESEFSRHTDEELILVILNGQGTMPPTDVTTEEAQAIVDHVRSLF